MRSWLSPWLGFSLLSIVLFGAWGVVSKMTADLVPAAETQILFTIGIIPTVIAAWWWARRSDATGHASGYGWAWLTGLIGGLGNWALFAALNSGGKAAVVLPFAALFPLVTL